jgi:ribose/xylose/arabinose/galactoside ABC-type transport system permease subunit
MTAVESNRKHRVVYWMKTAFVTMGVLPLLLVVAIVVFSLISTNFLTIDNLKNVTRQSVDLIIVALGQMLALLTGGFDLSVGTTLALTSVSGALAMAKVARAFPDAPGAAILIGILGGISAGTLVGVANGIGIALFEVSPFIMTLGMMSVVEGIALFLTGGRPVRGLPVEFEDTFGFGVMWGVPIPIVVAAVMAVLAFVLVNRTKLGRYFYAVGGNPKAARLSGVSNARVLFITYVLCAFLTSIAGLLLTARQTTGEANIGASMPLASIAACVIAGVSLRGGFGRVENVVLGALFISLVQNGMNLAQISSYLQMIVLGSLLILAVVADQKRLKILSSLQD